MHDATRERAIPGLDGYTADAEGNVYSYRSGARRTLSPKLHRTGYHYVNVKRDGRPATLALHGLILRAFEGEKPSQKHEARHRNGEPLDNRAANLKWGTSVENKADCVAHGTATWLRRGDHSNASKVTEDDVRSIEARAWSGESQSRIAADYGITQRHVSAIKHHETWTHLWGEGR